jgi:Alpha galactosidase A/Alpha galactosidase C-terminal beta sandwich domain/Carbohydrate binding module (family 35)
LQESNLLAQTDAIAARLKPFGYRYVNIDAGWWRTWDWKPEYDANGRPQPDPEKFPDGMKYVADYIHRKGLKAGIYLPVGLEKEAYDQGGDFVVAGAPQCHAHDLVYPDKRTTNGWDSAYKLDFSRPCAQLYVDSVAAQFAAWGYDFLKLDGVGPGSNKSGPNYDNRPDVAAWSAALAKTARPITFVLSWSLDIKAIDAWKASSNGWRIDTDVECYCNTLVQWDHSVRQRWNDLPPWISAAGPGGWNNLDSVDVGNATMDGLTDNERQSYMTLWAISAAPLYTGDDVTKLDRYGLSLLTNREVIAVDQQGNPARPLSTRGSQQVWRARNPDGSYTVALFNLASRNKNISVDWSDLGFAGPARVRDLWQHRDLGSVADTFATTLPGHASRLLRVTPVRKPTVIEAENAGMTGAAGVADCSACSGGKKVGNLDKTAALRFTNVTVARAGGYRLTVSYVDGSAGRSATMSVNGAPGSVIEFDGGNDGDWNRVQGQTVSVNLNAGTNTIALAASGGAAPDVDSISVTGPAGHNR